MMGRRLFFAVFLLFGILFSLGFVSSYTSSNFGYNSGTSSYYSINSFNDDFCNEGQDFVLQVNPFECVPAVVRSDLLEEQNVPVFCPIIATKVNPLLQIDSIKTITFSGNYPKEVSGIRFHPAQSALNKGSVYLNKDYLETVGYVAIVLRKQVNESAMPEWVQGNVTANIRYDSSLVFGVGEVSYYIPVLDDDDWEESYPKYSFWGEKAALRVEEIDGNSARIGVYQNVDDRITSFTLNKGGISQEIKLPGFYCSGGLKVKLADLKAPEVRAKLNIDGDVKELTKGERFLDNKCRILDVKKSGVYQYVKISCREDDGKTKSFELSILPEVGLKIGDSGVVEKFSIGDKIYSSNNVNYYLVYFSGKESNVNAWVLATSENFGDKVDSDRLAMVSREISKDENVKNISLSFGEVRKISGSDTFRGLKVSVSGFVQGSGSITNSDVKRNFDNSISDYFKVVNDFSDERENPDYDKSSLYGLLALQKALELDKVLNGGNMKAEIVELWKSSYPDEKFEYSNQGFANSGNSAQGVVVSGFKTISLEGVLEPTKEESSADVTIRYYENNQRDKVSVNTASLGVGERMIFPSSSSSSSYDIILNELSDDYAEFSASFDVYRENEGVKGSKFASRDFKLRKDQRMVVYDDKGNRYEIYLNDLNVEKVAHLEVIPSVDSHSSKADFSFKIGIEKRAIQLSPEQIKNRIDSLNDTIKTIEDISESLGSVVKGLKAACFATGTFLTVKSFFNSKAESYSRGIVMRGADGEGGWTKQCSDWVKDGLYSTLDECYSDNSNQIEADVDAYAKIVEEQNKELKALDDKNSEKLNDNLFKVNEESWLKDFVDSDYNSNLEGYVDRNFGQETFNYGGDVTYSNATSTLISSGGLSMKDSIELDKIIRLEGKVSVSDESNKNKAKEVIENAYKNSQEQKKFEEEQNKTAVEKGTYYYTDFRDSPQVLFFDNGLPSLVPVDYGKGWYVKVDSKENYDSSGNVNAFNICNVGKDGVISSDDSCNYVRRDQISSASKERISVANLEPSQASSLLGKSVDAIKQASRAYRPGITEVRIGGKVYKVGRTSANLPKAQCQDFMSTKDCKLLFNVCDPVICPASRCNMGGNYYVNDVIQTGIIGSIALCLPNYQEGIIVPVCLTGVKAGLDALNSIFTAYRDCLQENLETGKTVGICDEIHSIYLCEFMWKQASFIFEVVKGMVGNLYSGGPKMIGGGEYLNLVNSWSNAEASANYMTQSYGANAFKAFQLRSTDEVGSEVCKMFISARYPSSAEFFDALLAGDSPAQFHGRFDEISHAANVDEGVSHYKVWFHIYAGKDIGAYYKIYLRNRASSDFTQDGSTMVIDTGYIKKGDYADETFDKLGPSGYKEMCIVVNGQEECGFKQVSTSFAVNYVEDKYLEEQASQKNIQGTKECVSGTSSLFAMASPNLQAGAEEALSPSLNNRGLVRVCASENPGLGTDGKANSNGSRWSEVGTCDDGMKCWLDTDSVKNVIDIKSIEGGVLTEVNAQYQNILAGEIEDYTALVKKINELQTALGNAHGDEFYDKVIVPATKLIQTGSLFANDEARLLYIRGQAYDKLARYYGYLQEDSEYFADLEKDEESSSIDKTLMIDSKDGICYESEFPNKCFEGDKISYESLIILNSSWESILNENEEFNITKIVNNNNFELVAENGRDTYNLRKVSGNWILSAKSAAV